MAANESTKYTNFSNVAIGTASGGGGLKINGTALTATMAELNAAADKSAAAVVSVTATPLACTQATHANKTMVLNLATGIAITLPEATGTGDSYTFVLGTALSSGSITITTADTTNADYAGQVTAVDLDAATTPTVYQSLQASGNDVITMNRTTQGGVNVGADWYRVTDIGTDLWWVEGNFLVPAGSNPVTPFSST